MPAQEMVAQEIYEITRNYAVATAVFLIISIFGLYLSLKRKDNGILHIMTTVFLTALAFAMMCMNFTITLLHDGFSSNDSMLVNFCLYGWLLSLVLVGISAIISSRNILKQNKKQQKLNY